MVNEHVDSIIKSIDTFNSMLCFMLGLVGLIYIPTVHGIFLFNVFLPPIAVLLIVSFIFSSNMNQQNSRFSLGQVVGIFAVLLFIAGCALGSSINNESEIRNGLTILFKLLLILCCAFCIDNYKSDRLFNSYFRGFLTSCILTSVWMLVDAITFYFVSGQSINGMLFSSDASNISHGFTNITDEISILPFPYFRPSGFSWDPGLVVPGLVLGIILADHYRSSVSIKTLLISAIIISFSRTAYFVLGAYCVYKILCKIFSFRLAKTIYPSTILAYFLYSLHSIYAQAGFAPGATRHLRYIGSLIYIYRASISQILFGYGLIGSGIFYNNSVPWMQTQSFVFTPGQGCECGMCNLLLAGGIIGALCLLYISYYLFTEKNNFLFVVCMSLLIAGIGYFYLDWAYMIFCITYLYILKRRHPS